MNLAEWLVRSARRDPANPALLRGEAVVADYAGFARSAAALAASLRDSHAVRPGDRVAVFAANLPQYLVAMWGVWTAGAVVVPVNARLHAQEAAWIVENAGSVVVFATGSLASALAPLLPRSCRAVIDLESAAFAAMAADDATMAPVPRDADDLAWLFYTSGTTGRPKGVMITHGNLHAMAFSYFVDVDSVNAADAALYAAPMSHGAGLYNVQHVLRGARHAVPESGGFDAAEILHLAGRLDSVHMFAAPTMVRRLVDAARSGGGDGSGIRTIVYGGGPMYVADIVEAVEVMGPRFCQIYGQGESPMAITALARRFVVDRTHPRWRERLASVGTAQSCVELAVVGSGGNRLPAGETGEIVVRGAPVMAGYWNDPMATAQTLREGWLWTGDMGVLDRDGFLTLKDRSRDVIISGGSNIYPREVEEVLLAHPAVREVSVVGEPDPKWGEIVVAFVVADSDAGVATAALDALCLESIARFKRPKKYRFLAELPKNNYGKVLKTRLRAMLAEEAGTR